MPSRTRDASNPLHRVPAPALFLASGFTQYYGAALAVGLFAVLPAVAVAEWRLIFSALVLLAWRRPWRRRWDRQALAVAALFGVVLATMNVVFYLAIDYLPLGTAVAIEFIGPVAVAAVTGRGWRERAGIGLAALGVVLLAGVSLQDGWSRDLIVGLTAIGASAAAWAGYILLGRRVALPADERTSGLDALAVGMTVGAVLYAPLVLLDLQPLSAEPTRWLFLLGIAVLSSVIPYALEQVVLRRVSAARFAILLALLPVAAAATGALALGQTPSWPEAVGIALVCGAIVLSAQRSVSAAPAAAERAGPTPLP